VVDVDCASASPCSRRRTTGLRNRRPKSLTGRCPVASQSRCPPRTDRRAAPASGVKGIAGTNQSAVPGKAKISSATNRGKAHRATGGPTS
jgi:hypothetical protein